MKLHQLLVVIFSLVFLNACKPKNSPYQTYLERLHKVLEIKSPLTVTETSEKALILPSKRTLKLDNQVSNLSIREFLSLRQCKLHVTLAHRNSLIGKVASDSQLLINDLEILAYGPACLDRLGSSPLKDKLEEFLRFKKQTMNASLWNAILAADEYQKFWRRSQPHSDYPKTLAAETIDDLTAIVQFIQAVKNRQYAPDSNASRRLEDHLGNLRFGDGGALLFEYESLTTTMINASKLLETALEQPLCFNNKPNTKARYFKNVIDKFFIDGIQSKSVLLNKRKSQILPAIQALEESLIEQAPDSFLNWRKYRQTQFSANKEIKRHAQLIQKIYAQCGLQAGSAL